MEAQSNFEEYRRITLIANSKITVSEESPVYNFFAQRKEICKRLGKTQTDSDREYSIQMLKYIEENIKEYLLL